MIDERDAWAVLASVEGLGPRTFARLLREHGSAVQVLELAVTAGGRERISAGRPGTDRGDPARDRVPAPVVERLGLVAGRAAETLDGIRAAGLVVLTIDDPGYPARLRAIEEPPAVLFVRGSPAALVADRAVAVVGTRRPTDAGRRIAASIARTIAGAGAAVVSGLAVGIDGAAHAAVVEAGLVTVAVLGSGHRRLFPRAHTRLADAIVAAGGALVSELPPDAHPTRGTFPRRNRVISGLADATVVVEAATRSGALITAGWALEQGRGCFLVPGSIEDPRSGGCLAFLRAYPEAARIVAGIPELLEDLDLGGSTPVAVDGPVESAGTGRTSPPDARGPAATAPSVGRAALLASLGATEARVAGSLADGATTLDDLAAATDLPAATLLGTLTLLEMRGLVTGAFGRYRPAGDLAMAGPGLPGRRSSATVAADRRARAPVPI